MIRNLSYVFTVMLFAVSSGIGQEAIPFIFDRQVVSKPDVQIPAAAIESGLGGVVRVSASVDSLGNVVSVGKASGPDSVCAHVDRADVVALRTAAADAAKLVKFAPIKEGEPELARSAVEFNFPSKIRDPLDSTSGGSDDNAVPVTGVVRDTNRYTMKGDISYNAANAPPPDYKGSVNTSSGAAGNTVPGKALSGGVLNGKATSLPKPPYPPAARAVRASGAVSIQVLIDTNGEVFSAKAVSGHPLLRPAATVVACAARFTPTFLEDKPVRVSGIITYNFVP